MVAQVDQMLRANGLAEVGDYVIVVAGSPIGVIGSTNSIVVHKIGDEKGGDTV
ncbi:Pyruvate kinase [compost metagenome]